MAKSRKTEIRERVAKLLQERDRFVPMWARIRVYRCSCGVKHSEVRDENWTAFAERHDGKPVAGELLPELRGGLWDRLLRQYVPGAQPGPGDVFEIPVHEGQLPFVTHSKPKVMRVMALGGPGSGKTRALTWWAIWNCLPLHGDRRGGLVGATADRVRDVIRDDFLRACPPHWIDDENEHEGWIKLVHGFTWDLVTAQEQSKRAGSKVQGRNWWLAGVDETQNVHDRVQMDIDERGRNAGTDYKVGETATNFGLAHFEAKKERYKGSPYHDIVRLNPLDNPWISPSYWERFKASYTGNTWRRRILAEDVPPEQLVYARFLFGGNTVLGNVRPRPIDRSLDVTREITFERYGNLAPHGHRGWEWIVGTDFGTLTTVSTWLKVFREPNTKELLWWACMETVSGSHSRADQHARRLMQIAHPADFICIADPGINTKDADKSDYELMRREGLFVRPAHHEPIRVLHRVNMFNTLLEDARGKRRFFIDRDQHGREACPKLVQSLLTMTFDDHGNPENVRKDFNDPTHYPASAQYGVFPWEQIRGRSTLERVTGADLDPLLAKAMRYHARRRTAS